MFRLQVGDTVEKVQTNIPCINIISSFLLVLVCVAFKCSSTIYLSLSLSNTAPLLPSSPTLLVVVMGIYDFFFFTIHHVLLLVQYDIVGVYRLILQTYHIIQHTYPPVHRSTHDTMTQHWETCLENF
mmetsp:Transcript_24874/g.38344  ORF Transcript_24874/g.38344 Transcript_24874/m.38344 type:complete len:127 (-) Transcript_24874:903-1283(-)